MFFAPDLRRYRDTIFNSDLFKDNRRREMANPKILRSQIKNI